MCDTTSGSNCTGPQPTLAPVPGESATIDQTVHPFAKWNGQVYAIGQTTDPTACPNEQTDSMNSICDHFQLTAQDTGTVTVLLTWPTTISTNDFDLLVCVDVSDPLFTDQDCFQGTFVIEDLASAVNEPGFATVTFPAVAGTTYDIRALPFSIIASGYTGCAAYGTLTTSACGQPPPPPPPPPATSTTCPTDSNTANFARRITGGANLTPDSAGSTKEHASLNVAHKLNGNSSTFQGKVNYRKDDQIEFKSSQISCATFHDEGADSKGDPKGSAEIRGFGKLVREDPTTGQKTESNSCFRAFARDNGDPGGSQNGGSDQFSIEFVDPTTDPTTNQLVCTFNDLPANFAAPTIFSGNIDYHLNA